MNNLLIDSGSLEHFIDDRYSLASISKNAYQVLKLKVGSDEQVIICGGLTPGELKTIKLGLGSIALLQQTFANLFIQFVIAHTDKGYQCRVKTPFHVYRLTP